MGKPPSSLTPQVPALMLAQNSGTVWPIGVTTPMPVTTTRRFSFIFDMD